MTEKEKDLLAKLCGYSNERYTDKVKEGVWDNFDNDKEHSIYRKTLKRIIEIIQDLGVDITDDEVIADFLKCDEKVEQIKSDTKKELELKEIT